MSNHDKYSYELKQNFFASLSFRRNPEIPDPINIPIETQVTLAEPGFPVLQVGIKVKTPDDSPVFFYLELYGIFEYQGEKKEYDHDLNVGYAFERGLYLLWPNISQMVRIITSQMGMNPIQIRNPVTFGSGEEARELIT
jgi:hypothetical protein